MKQIKQIRNEMQYNYISILSEQQSIKQKLA